MAGLNPNKSDFDILPPHFTKGLMMLELKKNFSLCSINIIVSLDENDVQNIRGRLIIKMLGIYSLS